MWRSPDCFNASAFIVLSESCSGSQLAPSNGTCAISVVFAPSSPGSNQTADLLITDSATGSPQIVPLLGNGLPPAPLVFITPATLVYSNQADRLNQHSPAEVVTIQNNGSAPLKYCRTLLFLGTAAGDFSISGSTCGALPSSIALRRILRVKRRVPADCQWQRRFCLDLVYEQCRQ